MQKKSFDVALDVYIINFEHIPPNFQNINTLFEFITLDRFLLPRVGKNQALKEPLCILNNESKSTKK